MRTLRHHMIDETPLSADEVWHGILHGIIDESSPDLAHLVWMARMDGAKAHAWHRAQEMAKTCPEMWADMPRMLTEAMRETVRSETSARPAGGTVAKDQSRTGRRTRTDTDNRA